ncbi:hypothetical protein EVJ32_04965 [Exiguobacterium sp. SH5S4]|uniref:hypothetical protein n=1 Tax=Exiguobacterium sp. SH5S4 TaxID=2510961 RepID=UPI00103CAE0C|nr:hypothetical protein [Exiguobacterium sp. SH5S4]TCI26728.1 hypothetical protein EVJ32_04965 [Exiguobacterium sp. SH5S4]
MQNELKFTHDGVQQTLKLGGRFEIDGEAAVIVEFFKDLKKRRVEVLTEVVDEDGFTFVQKSFEPHEFAGFKRIKVVPAHIHEEAVAAIWRAKLLHAEEELAEAEYDSSSASSRKAYDSLLKSKNKALYETYSLVNFEENKGEVIVYGNGYKRELVVLVDLKNT